MILKEINIIVEKMLVFFNSIFSANIFNYFEMIFKKVKRKRRLSDYNRIRTHNQLVY